MGLQQRAYSRLRLCAGKTVYRLTILEQHHGRQAANAKAGDDVLLEVAVDLGQEQLTLIALGDGLQHRHEHFARRAPFGPEIHQHRFVEGVLDDRLIEIGRRGVEDVRRLLTHEGSRKSVNVLTIRAAIFFGFKSDARGTGSHAETLPVRPDPAGSWPRAFQCDGTTDDGNPGLGNPPPALPGHD
ncbi:hypothetical protein D3C84_695550 [compost metagenome]